MIVSGGLEMKVTNEMCIPMLVKPVPVKDVIRKRLVPHEIISKSVFEYYGIEIDFILKKTRKREVLHKRQVLQYMMERFTPLDLKSIGRKTGGYDHATVLHSKTTIQNLLDTYPKHRLEIEEIESMIYQELLCVGDIYLSSENFKVRDIQLERRKGTIKK